MLIRLGLDDVITFGKYYSKKPLTIEEIIELDPEYLAWALDNIEWFEVTEEAQERLDYELWKDKPF